MDFDPFGQRTKAHTVYHKLHSLRLLHSQAASLLVIVSFSLELHSDFITDILGSYAKWVTNPVNACDTKVAGGQGKGRNHFIIHLLHFGNSSWVKMMHFHLLNSIRSRNF